MSIGVHQVLAGAASRDAITRHALHARDVIRELGYRSEIFCERDHIEPALRDQIAPHTRWSHDTGNSDVAILHYSIASPAFWEVADQAIGLAIHYHNITPAKFLWEFAPGIAQECALGRRRLPDLAGRVSWAAADSHYNADELARLGYPPAEVIGILGHTRLPRSDPPAAKSASRILFVGRGVPNKAQHDLVFALAALREVGTDVELRLVGSWAGLEAYERYCMDWATRLGVDSKVVMTGSIDDVQLAEEYAAADLFVCLSDHEGYCVPLVEAMEHELPIVAFARAAVPETTGSAALLLPFKTPSIVAEAVVEVLDNSRLQEQMATGRATQLAQFSREQTSERLAGFVEKIACGS